MPEQQAKFSTAINKDKPIAGNGARPVDIKLQFAFIYSKGPAPANEVLTYFI